MRPRPKAELSAQLQRDVDRWIAAGNTPRQLPGFNMRTSFAVQPKFTYAKTKNA